MTPVPPATIRRIVYLGTPDLAVGPLIALHRAGYEIPLVVSRPDARSGRGRATQASPVKLAALELGLDVSDDLDDLLSVDADMGAVVAYGRIISTALLDALAFVNMHFSLLPRWRGAAPVERAILAGDTHTGVCLMELAEELDTGAVYRRDEVAIDPDETLDELRGRLIELGTTQLLSALRNGLGRPVAQQGQPTYAAKITAVDREIDWTESAATIHRQVRVGGAFTTFRGRRFKIHGAAPDPEDSSRLHPGEINRSAVGTGSGVLLLAEVQSEGKPKQAAADWLNGARLTSDDRLGS